MKERRIMLCRGGVQPPEIPSSSHQPGDIIRTNGQFVTRQTYQNEGLSDGVGVVVDSSGSIVRVISKFLGYGEWGPTRIVSGCKNTTYVSTALSDMDGEQNTNAVINQNGEIDSFGVIRRNSDIQNVSSSEWYMPSVGELSLIKSSYSSITQSLVAIKGQQSSYDPWGNHAWLSTQYDAIAAWCWHISTMQTGAQDNGLSRNNKNTNYNTPIYGFKKIYM